MRLLLAVAVALGQLAAAQQPPPDHGLRDVPLAGGALQYLDGLWVASCDTAQAPPPLRNGSCSFEANVDFDVTNTSTAGMMSAKDAADCCYHCWNRPGCFAAVGESPAWLLSLAAGCSPAAPATRPRSGAWRAAAGVRH
jgi:hypothetical protein